MIIYIADPRRDKNAAPKAPKDTKNPSFIKSIAAPISSIGSNIGLTCSTRLSIKTVACS